MLILPQYSAFLLPFLSNLHRPRQERSKFNKTIVTKKSNNKNITNLYMDKHQSADWKLRIHLRTWLVFSAERKGSANIFAFSRLMVSLKRTSKLKAIATSRRKYSVMNLKNVRLTVFSMSSRTESRGRRRGSSNNFSLSRRIATVKECPPPLFVPTNWNTISIL